MVFYRKYRPQTIEELDSNEVRDLLSSILASKDIAHAFLFTGPKGLGKTSAARIVAKVVNCEKVQSSKLKVKSSERTEPCNKCYQCISITNGTNIDVLEIDGASNRGIDEIRDLREKVRLAPASASRKIYIIDEVHMLTQEAFNALLKTLEEPPSHVIFILCTTEPHKVPATIVSRCFHTAFKKASPSELVRSLKRVSGKEKLTIDDETLIFIASLSDGSFRDGAKILEEMAVFNKKITKELVEQKYQIRQLADQISQMIGFLSTKSTVDGLRLMSRLVEQGVDIKYFLEQLISELHQMLLVGIGVNDARGPVPTFPPASAPSISSKMRAVGSPSSRATPRLNITEIKQLVELLSKAYTELRYAVLPQLPLELVIVEWGMQKSVLRSLRQFENSSNASVPAARYSSPRDTVAFGDSSEKFSHAKAPLTLKEDAIWQALINKVKLYNHSIAGVLRGCSLKSYNTKKIVIETGYKFHKERLGENNNLAILKKVCSEIAGNKIEVSVILKK